MHSQIGKELFSCGTLMSFLCFCKLPAFKPGLINFYRLANKKMFKICLTNKNPGLTASDVDPDPDSFRSEDPDSESGSGSRGIK